MSTWYEDSCILLSLLFLTFAIEIIYSIHYNPRRRVLRREVYKEPCQGCTCCCKYAGWLALFMHRSFVFCMYSMKHQGGNARWQQNAVHINQLNASDRFTPKKNKIKMNLMIKLYTVLLLVFIIIIFFSKFVCNLFLKYVLTSSVQVVGLDIRGSAWF